MGEGVLALLMEERSAFQTRSLPARSIVDPGSAMRHEMLLKAARTGVRIDKTVNPRDFLKCAHSITSLQLK